MHNPPLASTGSRSPTARLQPIPAAVRSACQAMVHDGIGFIDAAKANGLKPDTMRRWLHRPEVVGLLRRERAAFRAAVCAANEAVLASIRDEREGNQMARVHAIRTLENLDEGAAARSPGTPSPGVTIRIVNQVAVSPEPSAPSRLLPSVLIDAQPAPAEPRRDAAGHLLDADGERMFDPRRAD
jgi:hypothetical protein